MGACRIVNDVITNILSLITYFFRIISVSILVNSIFSKGSSEGIVLDRLPTLQTGERIVKH
jgi:hypothetical protein